MRNGQKYIYLGVSLVIAASLLMGVFMMIYGTVPDIPFVVANAIFFSGMASLAYYMWKYVIPEERELKKKGVDKKVDEFVREWERDRKS